MEELLEDEWEKFLLNDTIIDNSTKEEQLNFDINNIPKSTELYISTKTKISYLNREIPLQEVFWKIPILEYFKPEIGFVKKQIKFNFINKEDVDFMEEKIKNEKNVEQNIITQIVNPEGRIKFKDIRKISIGLCKKDIISYRTKKKSAFYNCFVVIMRILYNKIFREIHIKVFNTGKLEIPGIQNDELLKVVLEKLVSMLKPILNDYDLNYIENKTETVLINSNFNCGYYINREKLFDILKYKYKINSSYDPCSYPGIQCEFYYNKEIENNTGQQTIINLNNEELNTSNILKISFMIFRTGSVLIVGKCEEKILYDIYNFIKNILLEEYVNIMTCNIEDNNEVKKKKTVRRKNIYIRE